MLIDINGLTKTYRTTDVITTALNNISIGVEENEFVSIMGPSGCGKSTLLNIFGLLDSPTGGSFKFLGEELAGYSESQLTGIRKKNIGFIFQSFHLVDELTVRENVELALVYHGVAKSERKLRVQEVLERVDIMHRINHFPSQLSGGQQQRVAVARAIVSRPKLILADEPTGNLDSVHGGEVMKMLCDLNKQGTAVIMVTHSSEHAKYSSRVIKMLDGKVLQ